MYFILLYVFFIRTHDFSMSWKFEHMKFRTFVNWLDLRMPFEQMIPSHFRIVCTVKIKHKTNFKTIKKQQQTNKKLNKQSLNAKRGILDDFGIRANN